MTIQLRSILQNVFILSFLLSLSLFTSHFQSIVSLNCRLQSKIARASRCLVFGVWSAVNWPAVSSASVVSFVAIQALVQFSIDYCLLTHSPNSLRIATFDCLFSPLPKSEVLVHELAFWDSVCLLGFSIFLFSSLKAANSFCQLGRLCRKSLLTQAAFPYLFRSSILWQKRRQIGFGFWRSAFLVVF